MRTSPPDLSIVIVNWNSCQFLAQCLRSVFAHEYSIDIEIVVIDNASYDGSAELIERNYPGVIFIQSTQNLGFARANNAATAQSTGRQVLFLNPDTEVIGDAIERMSRFLDATPNAGAVGCKLLNTDRSLQTSCVQAYPTVLNQAVDSAFFRRLFPRSSLWGTQAFLSDEKEPAQVEGLSGACILVRRDAFDEVGHFTEDYFMYAEDMDLCFKLQQSGRVNYYMGDCVVVHHGGQSSAVASENQFGNVLMRESIAKFLRLHRGPLHAGAFRLALGISALLRVGFLGMVRLLTLGQYHPRELRGASRKWAAVLRWSVGAEGWVRNVGSGAT